MPFKAHGRDLASDRVAIAFATPAQALAAVGGQRPRACRTVNRAEVSQLVRSIAQKEGFDADLAEAIAWAESDLGTSQGPSKAGALGIMQLMPGTAADLGVNDRCDTEANVRAGLRYLKSLYDEFQDPLLMLAAYNAGPNSVYKAQGIPVNPETAEYIVKILNRWKFGGVVKKSALTKSETLAAAPPASEDAWQDGHVMDFGN
ncbi:MULTISPECIES: transglycosylase SLT domain-containing protein [unclassified Mesorhizobium]|uniref:lytic transglycosylase domain-containing protein n=1 Tax=unclassified Mesorhizobium TaxID=325217 RepID=UPI002414D737|nr:MULTISPECIES: transglycosylase SLT domain-containing protein [unclassified Mesorhizobium]MDG4904194.1 transglycosylase SLT domain-containing protein [Mesorhizobium sp. WSM4962]MDG4909221.1 transglycosylase SLT domain-containing protein [Mesorhizobium sp. WSM4898]MDG4921845.1 transglycosylase SLT domain-containing protein [Mesorhizobium sp. WSM4989]